MIERIPPRYLGGLFVIIIVAALIFTERVPWEPGLLVIVGVAAALGLYEGGRELGRRENR